MGQTIRSIGRSNTRIQS